MTPKQEPKLAADLLPVLTAVLSWQLLGERGEKGPGSEGSVARARGDRGLPRYGPSANTGMFTMCTVQFSGLQVTLDSRVISIIVH